MKEQHTAFKKPGIKHRIKSGEFPRWWWKGNFSHKEQVA